VLINVLPPVVEVISLYKVPARVTVDRSPGYAYVLQAEGDPDPVYVVV
jgi:hypothetical protein